MLGVILNQGINPTAVPTDHLAKRGNSVVPDEIYPSAYGLYEAETAFYEYLGLAWEKLLGQV